MEKVQKPSNSIWSALRDYIIIIIIIIIIILA
jgi:hypothetical protein